MRLDAEGLALRARLLHVFEADPAAPLDDAAFDTLARDIFAWQFERNLPLAAWCRRRGRTPADIDHWSEIPAVPTAAFKEVALVAGSPADATTLFRTSGTTRGTERRGTHYLPDVSIYEASLAATFHTWLLPDGSQPRMLSLMPSSKELPDSSLAHMIDTVMERFGAPGGGTFATRDGGLDSAGLERAISDATDAGEPVCLLATTLAFAHWMDALRAAGLRFRLPDGSRLMDTGGPKGTTRVVDEAAMRDGYANRLGLPAHACINEYGMTELSSQFYDSSLRDHHLGRAGPRRKQGPAWVRSRIVDPDTLQPLDDARAGLLQHFDLANLGSACAIQTEDVGYASDDGFVLLGRASGAQPRGCSIAVDELLAAARRP